jgi:hypothetical protein
VGLVQQHHTDPDVHLDPDHDAALATKVLDELVARAVGEEHDVARLVVNDCAGHALMEAAGIDASLVVVGTRGTSGFRGLMLGSVSRYVLHAATGLCRSPTSVIGGSHHRARPDATRAVVAVRFRPDPDDRRKPLATVGHPDGCWCCQGR